MKCDQGDFVFFQNPHSAVSGLIFDRRGRVMLVKRKYNPKKGFWDTPGGFVGWGENPKQAVIRELREELKVHFQPQDLSGIFHDWYDMFNLRYSVYNIYYTGTISGRPRPASDVAAIRWFPLNRLPQKISFSHIRRALRHYRTTHQKKS
ncbi:MAG: NUDIX hydrolase [Candidatus Kerfeldbacteria bacterium]|nr:NUDIX hydrolase [Candidatus Kerfeldbacteria bacterium]